MLSFVGPMAQSEEFDVDVELVLAVDGSASVNYIEYRLQQYGIASAFRDAEVVEAIQAGRLGRIAVTVMVWSRGDAAKDVIGWYIVSDDDSARRFARAFERRQRLTVPSSTGIAEAIHHAAILLEANGIRGKRRVIDISGDGQESVDMFNPSRLAAARRFALSTGLVINGLAILTEEPDLLTYYGVKVIGGSGAFVIAAASFENFAQAMKKKLIREILIQSVISLR